MLYAKLVLPTGPVPVISRPQMKGSVPENNASKLKPNWNCVAPQATPGERPQTAVKSTSNVRGSVKLPVGIGPVISVSRSKVMSQPDAARLLILLLTDVTLFEL